MRSRSKIGRGGDSISIYFYSSFLLHLGTEASFIFYFSHDGNRCMEWLGDKLHMGERSRLLLGTIATFK